MSASVGIAKRLANIADISRDEWLEIRRRGIGGSDAPVVCGLSPYKSPIRLYMEKIGEIEEEEPGEAAYWGTVLEDVVAKEFVRRTGLTAERRNAILQHPEYPWMLANVDRLVRSKGGIGVLECKTTSEWLREEWEDDKAPPTYVVQVQHYMAVLGLSYAYLAVLIGGNRFVTRLIPRDDDLINTIIALEQEFWARVERRDPPPMDGSADSAELLKRLYPEGKKKQVRLPSSAQELIEQYDEAKEAEKRWAERRAEAENRLKELLGDAEIGLLGDRKVEWKTVRSKRLDSKALKKAHPGIYEEFAKESSYRRFAVK